MSGFGKRPRCKNCGRLVYMRGGYWWHRAWLPWRSVMFCDNNPHNYESITEVTADV